MDAYNPNELNLIGNVNYIVCDATLRAARGEDMKDVGKLFDNARELIGEVLSRRTREALYIQILKAERCVDGSLF